jgi:cytochrome c biogenesis protein CcdA
VLAVAVALASGAAIDRMRRALPYVNRLSGVILVPVGLYVAYYGWYELRLFGGSGSADDPVVAAAGRVQRTLAGWVYHLGGWPWLLALVALVAIGAAGRTWRRRRHPSPVETTRLDSAA